MFYYLKGTVASLEPYLAVIDCGGVGYACNTTGSSLASLKVGEEATLYTYLHVREDLFDLYGFSTKNELSCFKLLLGISGVGPRAALSILSVCTPERLAMAVITGDEKALTSAQGIGKKIAQRIILELKDKIAKEQIPGGPVSSPGAASSPQSKAGEASAALAVLGFSAAEAAEALRGIDTEAHPLEEIIKMALKKMVR
jgi:Holliday junction DNA helicase RuvA